MKGGPKKSFVATIPEETGGTIVDLPVKLTPEEKPAKQVDGVNMADLAAMLQRFNTKMEENLR